ncbi:MAG: hypothetical protein K2G76_08675 [Prevotella sp.]|nr:hypothetical protein [Prevotella sp.]
MYGRTPHHVPTGFAPYTDTFRTICRCTPHRVHIANLPYTDTFSTGL